MNHPQDLSVGHIRKGLSAGQSERSLSRVILNVIPRVFPQNISSRSVSRAYPQDLSAESSAGSICRAIHKVYPQVLSAEFSAEPVRRAYPQDLSAGHIRKIFLQSHPHLSAGQSARSVRRVICRVCLQGISSRSVRRAYLPGLSARYIRRVCQQNIAAGLSSGISFSIHWFSRNLSRILSLFYSDPEDIIVDLLTSLIRSFIPRSHIYRRIQSLCNQVCRIDLIIGFI